MSAIIGLLTSPFFRPRPTDYGLPQEEGEVYKSQRLGLTGAKQYLVRMTRTRALMISRQLSFLAQDLLMTKQLNILAWNRKGLMNLYPQLESYEELMAYGGGKATFMGVAPVDQTPFFGCPQMQEYMNSIQQI